MELSMPYFEKVPKEFSDRFCSWSRIEPRCRSDNFTRGLEARTADPLWMLARQWQMGEYIGEDNGSPIRVKVSYTSSSIYDVIPYGSSETISLQNAPPLETIVERETVGFEKIINLDDNPVTIKTNWRTRIQIGQQFERFLRREFGEQQRGADAIICTYRNPDCFGVEYPTGNELALADYATRRFLELMAGRAIDGWQLLSAIRYGADHELLDNVSIDDRPKLQNALDNLRTWYGKLYTEPTGGIPSAWVPNKFEYQFMAKATDNAGRQLKLVAPEYKNGDLEWHTFNFERESGFSISSLIRRLPVIQVIFGGNFPALEEIKYYSPTRIGFAGKPNERWWTIEKSNVDFGSLDVATTDIVKLMLMEFALVHADDWFMLPLEVPRNSITTIENIEVTNVFGETFKINRARDVSGNNLNHWELFALSHYADESATGGGEFLFVPAAIPFREESPVVEEVRFIRDEGANMVFAIEHTVQNQIGNPVDGFEAQLELRKRQKEAEANGSAAASTAVGLEGNSLGLPVYRLASIVPDNWIPFVPVHAGNSRLPGTAPDYKSIRLRQAQMLRNENDEAPTSISANTIILQPTPESPLEWVNEESVPRAGVKIQLTKQRVRWIDGKTYVWVGRKVTTGKGEGSSGLRFDYLKER
jgi:hypothetical protein